ncbi:MAG: tetratricopeptide repeat protein [Gammaproteobacteria bacterium]|nr:tetratricopeptide repeat protein [Gammaproteobacteria bacterium]
MTDKSKKPDASIAQSIQALRSGKPELAEKICREQLGLKPESAGHLRLLGHALQMQDQLVAAEDNFRLALTQIPGFARLNEDLGTVLAMQGKFEEAIPCFERAIQEDEGLASAHKKLGRALAAVGRGKEADEVFEVYFQKDPNAGAVAIGIEHLRAGREEDALDCFSQILRKSPDNVDAMRYLATVYLEQDQNLSDAEALLRRVTQLAPEFTPGWIDLGQILVKCNKRVEAIDAFEQATVLSPENFTAWVQLASANSTAGYPEKAVKEYRKAIELNPQAPNAQMCYGHVLKTLGDQPASLRAYREAIRLKPDFGQSYWSMANLKIFKFEETEVAAMETQLKNSELKQETEVHFRFALGKANEDLKDYDKAWHYYHSGNELKRQFVEYDPVANSDRHEGVREYFTRGLLSETEGNGFPDEGPIFIVGLGRSGSTLVEQILASHSQVEGTEELAVLGKISDTIGRYRSDGAHYPEALDYLQSHNWRSLGLKYLNEAKRYRMTDKPIFTDKFPNNYPFVGFLHLILPNAKIINARRHPLDSCLGNYKQLFGRGQNFTYDMSDLSEYYREYAQMMDHWNEVLPGKVLDVHYEEVVTDLEGQVARILEHCGLEFEEQCVRFHETERAVKTASSEQVRQPIYTGALGTWRKYESHLGEWQESLSPIINKLPDSVKNAGL